MKATLDHETHSAVLSPGSMLTDRLTIIRRIGTGGMGDVYEVEHKFTKHRRAAKVLHAQFLKNDEVVERFLREASAAGRIGNPHIVETFDAGHLADGSPFIVMEFLEGRPLGDVLRWNGRLDAGLASAVMCQVCTAVQAAHDANIIHRDLKPENLFLTERDGRAFIKVLDFGVSKFISDEDGPEMRTTRSGMTMGTPLYMAPEQLRGAKNADARSDVYSLGVILYEMLAGTAPFLADSFAELAVKVLTAEPRPLHLIDGGLPKQLSEIVARTIQKDPAERFGSARELGEVLAQFAKNCSVTLLLQHEVLPAGDGADGHHDTHLSGPAGAAAKAASGDVPAPAAPASSGQSVASASPAAGAPSLGASDLRAVGGGKGRRIAIGVLVVAAAVGVGAFGALKTSGAAKPPLDPSAQTPPPPPVVAPLVVAEVPKTTPVAPEPEAPKAVPPLAVEPTPPVVKNAEPPPVAVAVRAASQRATRPPAPTKGKGAKGETGALLPPPPPPPTLEAPAPRQLGSVDLACVPVSCTVTIDGKPAGETPLLGYQLEAGVHTAVFVNAETKATTTRKLEVKAGEHAKLPVRW